MCYAESLVRGKPRCTTCISCVAKIFLYNLELYRLSFSFSLSFLLTGVLSIACSHRGCCPSSFSLPQLYVFKQRCEISRTEWRTRVRQNFSCIFLRGGVLQLVLSASGVLLHYFSLLLLPIYFLLYFLLYYLINYLYLYFYLLYYLYYRLYYIIHSHLLSFITILFALSVLLYLLLSATAIYYTYIFLLFLIKFIYSILLSLSILFFIILFILTLLL